MKTAQEFEEAVKANNITEWRIRPCSLCHYMIGYLFKNGRVFFDSGCNCTYGPPTLVPATFEDLATHYNIQTNKAYKDEIRKIFNLKN